MSLIVAEVYEALIEAGASKEKAKAAASAIPVVERLATRQIVANLEKEMATKADIAASEKATKADIAASEKATKADIAASEKATKAEIARLDRVVAHLDKVVTRMDKKLAVLNLAVFSFIPATLTLLVKLVFFP